MAAGLIVLAALAAYHNSFAGVFVYDDQGSIVENVTIRRLWPIGPVLVPPCDGETVGGRPLLNLTLALNYAFGQLNVWGYHAVNLAIHIASALLLFGIVRRTFLTRPLPGHFGQVATPLALAGVWLWTIHPLQTESVTYIVQRAESLAGCFYLLTLYCTIRGATSSRAGDTGGSAIGVPQAQEVCSSASGRKRAGSEGKRIAGSVSFLPHSDPLPTNLRSAPGKGTAGLLWYVVAIVACLLGMATKETIVTAPILVLLYDRTFLAGSFRKAWRRRWPLYLGLAATWGLLLYLVWSTGLIARQGEFRAADPFSYARTQPGVILHYLRLSFWPRQLCLSYEWPLAHTLGEILPGAIVVGLLLAATVWGLAGGRVWGFLGAWFFLILLPTSSILPLTRPLSEHRMYLPLAAPMMLLAAGGYALWEKLLPRTTTADYAATVLRWAAPVVALFAALSALGYATVARNAVYHSAVALWEDCVAKSPQNAVGWCNLGTALADMGQIDGASDSYRRALQIQPDFSSALANLGNALLLAGKPDEAIAYYEAAVRVKPDSATALCDFANGLIAVGRIDEAIGHCRHAVELRPSYPRAHHNLGAALARGGKLDAAIAEFRQALRLQGDYAKAHNNLGLALARRGQSAEAIAEFRQAVRFKPGDWPAHYNLGSALQGAGRFEEALTAYREVCRLQPDLAAARQSLANLLARTGRTNEAIQSYGRCLEADPGSLAVHNDLAWLLATRDPSAGGDAARAVRLAERARDLSGRANPQCLDTLAAAYAAAGRFADALRTAERAAQLANAAGEAALAEKIQARMQRYRDGRPYRELRE